MWFSRVEHMAAAGKTLCARRVAAAGAFQESGQRSAASWLANETGDNLGTAINLLETAHQLKDLPALEDALRRGDLSPRRPPSQPQPLPRTRRSRKSSSITPRRARYAISAVRQSASVPRVAQNRTPRSATRRSKPSARFAGGPTPMERFVLTGGSRPMPGRASSRRSSRRRNAGSARLAGKDDTSLSRHTWLTPSSTSSPPFRTPSPGRAGRRTSHSVILRVDLAALRRGELEGGEVCEIPGVGPVPLAVARTVLGDAFMKLVITDGVDVQMVCHAGRHVSSFIDTALEERDPVCVVPGCDVANFLERDHWREEFAEGGPTDLPNLCRLCKRHHGLKHNKGFTLRGGPGKWEWIAPKDRAVGVDEPDDVPPWRAESE